MDHATLVAKGRRYWEIWLPQMTRELKEAKQFNAAIQIAAARAQAEIFDLRVKGYQEHEAQKLVLPKYIFLSPEKHE
ncbi:MAG: hypothetical protein EOO38_24410 [Cytophagaceae bacterium]|nr:MAG: hypothetical protein EOO38_24410 [Cytophagaceae bacterium]